MTDSPPPRRYKALPSEIRRRERLKASEEAGKVWWNDEVDEAAARKIHTAAVLATNHLSSVWGTANENFQLGTSDGVKTLDVGQVLAGTATFPFELENPDHEYRLDAVASTVFAFLQLKDEQPEEWVETGYSTYDPAYWHTDQFVENVNEILLGHRVDWHVVDGDFVRRGNSVLHAELIKPVTALLDADPKYVKAERAFEAAITELSANNVSEAISKAGVAVQEFLRALGVPEGNSVKDQIQKAQSKGLLTGYDFGLLKQLADWLNTDRATLGTAHHHREDDVSRADAWLMIHIAAAMMVRLSDETPRDLVAARELREQRAAEERQEAERAKALREEAARKQQANNAWEMGSPSGAADDMPF